MVGLESKTLCGIGNGLSVGGCMRRDVMVSEEEHEAEVIWMLANIAREEKIIVFKDEDTNTTYFVEYDD